MVLDGQRARVDFALAPVARKLINVNPNTISWIGLILALLCGAIFYLSGDADRTWLLLVGALMVIVSGYFDALDGKVAKLSGKAGPKAWTARWPSCPARPAPRGTTWTTSSTGTPTCS